MLAMVEDIKGQRDRMIAALPELGYEPLPSAANFVMFGGVADPHAVFEALLSRGIIIRDVGIPNHLRVTAGSDAETTLFLAALAEIGEADLGRIQA
jgi:histidinol-phosphate aminotransferase